MLEAFTAIRRMHLARIFYQGRSFRAEAARRVCASAQRCHLCIGASVDTQNGEIRRKTGKQSRKRRVLRLDIKNRRVCAYGISIAWRAGAVSWL